MNTLLQMNNISRRYSSGYGTVNVLKGITLRIDAGEMVAIVGVSGSGKSTLMNILGCLDKATTGSYKVDGIDVSTLNEDELAKLRREHFGFIFQRYHLLSQLTALQNVELPAIYASIRSKDRLSRARLLLARLGLSERENHLPFQLSGGQQQRVSIARALMNGGQIILADEPTGALDRHTGQEVMTLLRQLCDDGHTVIVVTHDPQVAAKADRVIEICDGELISDRHSSKNEAATFHNLSSPESGWRQTCLNIGESLKMAFRAMKAKKMRALLTMLGIVIGIASVVSVVIVGDAAKKQVLADIQSIGANTIDIYPGKDFSEVRPEDQQSLTYSDLVAIRQQPWVSFATPMISRNLKLRNGNINVPANVSGVSWEYFSVYEKIFSEGNGFNYLQQETNAQVAVLDHRTRLLLFPSAENVVGKIIFVENLPVTIIGVVKEKPSMSGSNKILQVWLPYTTLSGRLTGQSWFNSMSVRFKENYNNQKAQRYLNSLLLLRHGKKNFITLNLDSIMKTAEKSAHTIQLFLTFVAIISLVVGGIGVMNIMLVSVAERTCEVGVHMAIGARKKDVLRQFLFEAIIICLSGGTLGIILSVILTSVLQLVLPKCDLSISLMAPGVAFSCSTLTGIFFGWLPARRAAQLDPVQSLSQD